MPTKRRQTTSKMSEVEGIFEAAYRNNSNSEEKGPRGRDFLSGRSEWTNVDLTYSQDDAATPKTLK